MSRSSREKQNHPVGATIVGSVLFTVFSFFLINEYIESNHATTLFIFAIFIGFAIYKADYIEELDFRNQIIRLKEIKAEIYAKAEVVKRLGEKAVKVGAVNSTRIGYYNASLSNEELLRDKKDYVDLLEELESDQDIVDAVSEIIDKKIVSRLGEEIRNWISKINVEWYNKNLNDVMGRLREYSTANRKEFEEYLKSNGVLDANVSQGLNKLDSFLNNRTV